MRRSCPISIFWPTGPEGSGYSKLYIYIVPRWNFNIAKSFWIGSWDQSFQWPHTWTLWLECVLVCVCVFTKGVVFCLHSLHGSATAHDYVKPWEPKPGWEETQAKEAPKGGASKSLQVPATFEGQLIQRFFLWALSIWIPICTNYIPYSNMGPREQTSP